MRNVHMSGICGKRKVRRRLAPHEQLTSRPRGVSCALSAAGVSRGEAASRRKKKGAQNMNR